MQASSPVRGRAEGFRQPPPPRRTLALRPPAGMLSNLGPLPLDRVHNMLRLFAGGGERPFDMTATELSRFLGRLVAAGGLALTDGIYSLRAAE